MLCWNIEGLTGCLRRGNDLDFSPHKVIMLTETFLTQSITEQLVPNYRNFYAEARKTEGRPSGGLAILTSPLIPNTKTMFKSDNILGVVTTNMTFVVAYYRPNTPVAEITVEINELLTKVNTNDAILYGDFNCRIDTADQRGADLTEALLHMNLQLLNKPYEKTYISSNGSSTIDLVFVTERMTTTTELKVQPTVARKHQRIELTRTAPGKRKNRKGNARRNQSEGSTWTHRK